VVNQTTLVPAYFTKDYSASLPFLAAHYAVNDNINVYAQASEGFLAPTVSAFYVFNPADAQIKPQKTTNLQTGVVFKSGRFTGDFDLYQVRATNFPITQTLATGETYYTNGGTAQYRGVEAEGSYSITNGLSAYASGALMNSKFTAGANRGLRVGEAPSYTAATGFIFDNGMFFGSLLQKFTGDYYGSAGQTRNSATASASLNKVAPYNTTDLVIGVRSKSLGDLGLGFGKSVEAKLGISNIFDHKNTTEVGGSPSTLVASDPKNGLTYQFLSGRLIYGVVTVGF